MKNTKVIKKITLFTIIITFIFTFFNINVDTKIFAETNNNKEYTNIVENIACERTPNKSYTYENYHFRTNRIFVAIDQEIDFALYDNEDKEVTKDLEWFVFIQYPNSKLFTPEETKNHLQELSSPIEIDTQRKTIKGIKYPHKNTVCYLVAVYKQQYFHLQSVKVIKKELPEAIHHIDQELEKIQKETANYSDVEKAAYVYKYLADKLTYNHEYVVKPAIDNILYLGQAVCAGYAKAFVYILANLGVEVEYASGNVSGNESHAWNRVKLDGEYYYVDVTWADQKQIDWTYFLPEHGIFKNIGGRQIHTPTTNLGKKYLFYNVELGSLFNIEDSIKQAKHAKDSLTEGDNTKKIFLTNEEIKSSKLKEIKEIFNSDGSTCYTFKPVQNLRPIGTIYEFNIKYVNSNIQNIKVKVDSITPDSEGNISLFTLSYDNPIKLDKHNFRINNGIISKFKKINEQTYIVGFNPKKNQQLFIEKTGYSINKIDIDFNIDNSLDNVYFISTDNNDFKKGVLYNTDPTMEYFLSGTWKKCQENTTPITATYYEEELKTDIKGRILIRKMNKNGIYGPIKKINITSESNYSKGWALVENDKINSTWNTQYRKVGESNWIDAPINLYLPNGKYQIRLKGRKNEFPTEHKEIVINVDLTNYIEKFNNAKKEFMKIHNSTIIANNGNNIEKDNFWISNNRSQEYIDKLNSFNPNTSIAYDIAIKDLNELKQKLLNERKLGTKETIIKNIDENKKHDKNNNNNLIENENKKHDKNNNNNLIENKNNNNSNNDNINNRKNKLLLIPIILVPSLLGISIITLLIISIKKKKKYKY